MSGLVEFIRARLDDDERAANDANPDPTGRQSAVFNSLACYSGDILFVKRWTASRVLSEIDAKRAILDLHDGAHECSTYRHGEIDNCTWCLDAEECSTALLLAAPFRDHPDFSTAWAVEVSP